MGVKCGLLFEEFKLIKVP